MAVELANKANRLNVTKDGGRMVSDYWENIFTARERGKRVVWYNGSAVNPIFQAAGLEWCHGEAFSARLAATHLEGPAQLAGAEYGYIAELCSYSRTHLGCAVLTQRAAERAQAGPDAGYDTGIVGVVDQDELAAKLPTPDFFVNAYAGCSTGQQWDEITFRVFGKKVPIFNVSLPTLWGNKADAGYLRGEEWDRTSEYVAKQLYQLIEFIEVQTGEKFDMDKLRENMTFIKKAATLRREAMDLCAQAPTPATFWDWISSIAQINFLPANQALVDYFTNIKAEIQQRLDDDVPGIAHERYRLYFDGMMNWNKLGWLAKKFADHDVAVVAGRYTHNAFWQEPHLIDTDDPILGMAQHYLLCPTNHGAKTLQHLMARDIEKYGIDGVVFHSSRTCRAFTNPQHVLAETAQRDFGIQTMFFEGDVADASFYKDEVLDSRLEAMLEAIDVRRLKVGV